MHLTSSNNLPLHYINARGSIDLPIFIELNDCPDIDMLILDLILDY
jgi:hypothetical protein